MTGLEPIPETLKNLRDRDAVEEAVLAGKRPPLAQTEEEATVEGEGGGRVPNIIRTLIRKCWSPSPTLRYLLFMLISKTNRSIAIITRNLDNGKYFFTDQLYV